jgi:hypothetical protein
VYQGYEYHGPVPIAKKLTMKRGCMKKSRFISFVIDCCWAMFVASVAIASGDIPNAKLLPLAAVEKVTSVHGLTIVPKDASKRMIGDVNFVRPDGKRLLSVVFETIDLKAFEKTKATSSFKTAYNGPIKGVGDEAYDGPPNMPPFVLSVRKGTHWITISTSIDVANGMKPFLSQEQLKKIAEIIFRNGNW